MKATRLCTGTLLSVLALGVSVAAADRELLVGLSEAVDAEMIRRHTAVLGSDALEGRAPGTPGGDRAAAYIAGRLEALGLEPLGDGGSFLQQVPLHGVTALPESRLEIESLGSRRELALGDDYLLLTAGSQTLVPAFVPMVFVGYGIVAPEFDYNDYADLDVAGKVVVYLDGEPPSDDPGFFAAGQPTVYASPEAKKRIALSRGARGGVLIPSMPDAAGARWERTRRDFAFETLSLAYAVPGHLSLMLHPKHAEWLFADALYDWEEVRAMARRGVLRSFHLPAELRFEGRFRSRDVLAPNVVARLAGRDPRLAATAVVVSAHYDHLGVGPEVAGDAIYNGVVDNALGVAGVLEMARVLSTAGRRPRRPVIFLLTTAEEAGLLGSQFFLDNPPLPPSRMAANINVDGLAFNEPFDDVIGAGAELSTLGERLERVAAALGLTLSRPPDVFWSSESFARSDQLAFAERGVPSILVNEGFRWQRRSEDEAIAATVRWLEEIYHSPADDLAQPLDWAAASRHAGLLAALVYAVADDLREPSWYPGAPYAYERLLSLAMDR